MKQLRQIARDRKLRGYSKLRKAQLLDLLKQSLLGSPVLDIKAPVLQPTILNKAANAFKSFTGWLLDSPVPDIKVPVLRPKTYADWLLNYVPEPIKKPVSAVSSYISDLYNRNTFKIRENKSAIKGFTKQYAIDGTQGIDATTFLNTVRPQVVDLLEKIGATKLIWFYRVRWNGPLAKVKNRAFCGYKRTILHISNLM